MAVILFILLLLTPSVSLASSTVNVQTHIESNTDSRIEVNQQVSNTNSVSRKVEVEVNGEKHVYESNKEGSETIRVNSDGDKVVVSNSDNNKDKNTVTPKAVPSVTPLPEILPKSLDEIPSTSLADYIIESIKDFFKNLF